MEINVLIVAAYPFVTNTTGGVGGNLGQILWSTILFFVHFILLIEHKPHVTGVKVKKSLK